MKRTLQRNLATLHASPRIQLIISSGDLGGEFSRVDGREGLLIHNLCHVLDINARTSQ